MKAAEYDELLEDPSGFAMRKFLPRAFSSLEGLAMLPPIPYMLGGYVSLGNLAVLSAPPVRAALDALLQAADWWGRMGAKWAGYARRMEALGFPSDVGIFGAICLAPFDLLGDTLRGMRGIFLDMYRIPDKLLAALDHLLMYRKRTGDCLLPLSQVKCYACLSP